MQIFKGVASGKQSFREHCATKWLLEANPRNISASKISRYTVLSSTRLQDDDKLINVTFILSLMYYCNEKRKGIKTKNICNNYINVNVARIARKKKREKAKKQEIRRVHNSNPLQRQCTVEWPTVDKEF